MNLLSVEEALHQLLADAPSQGVMRKKLALSQGAVLAEAVHAGRDVPPSDNSAMDGYALRADDAPQGGVFQVSQRVAAGQLPEPLAAGTVARIFTGAMIPAGATAVVAQEDCERQDDGRLRINTAVRPGQHIRPRGQDIANGHCLLPQGHRLGPADLGLLASLGVAQINVAKPLRVALISTGDELVEAGRALGPGQIYNSNRPMLRALLAPLVGQVLDLGIVGDCAEDTRATLLEASQRADVVISTGGVSVGEEDHVKQQLASLGRLSLWKLAIKPGKPLAYGRIGDTPFFGLPGNPVSSFVTFVLLVRPYLLRMLGAAALEPPCWPVKAAFDWPKAGRRQEYLRARVSATGSDMEVAIHPQQSSGALSSVAWANALAVIAPGRTLVKGDTVDVIMLRDLY